MEAYLQYAVLVYTLPAYCYRYNLLYGSLLRYRKKTLVTGLPQHQYSQLVRVEVSNFETIFTGTALVLLYRTGILASVLARFVFV